MLGQRDGIDMRHHSHHSESLDTTDFVFKSSAGLLLFLIVTLIHVFSRTFGKEIRGGKFFKLGTPLTPYPEKPV